MKTLLTVDWDFFCEEKPEWDFGHQESLIFLKMLWTTRIGIKAEMRTTGAESGFWEQLRKVGDLKAPLWASDSHAYAYQLLKGVRRVVLFDAHHDCWMADSLGVDKKARGVYCHNWLRVWLNGSKKRSATWVRPGWQKHCELPDDMKGRVEVLDRWDGSDLRLDGPVGVHVCRSGCWVPPWLDGAFLAFLGAFGRGMEGVCRMQDGEWDPLVQRWTPEDLKQAEAMEADVQKMVRGMAVGSIPSGNFVDARVEQRLDVPVR